MVERQKAEAFMSVLSENGNRVDHQPLCFIINIKSMFNIEHTRPSADRGSVDDTDYFIPVGPWVPLGPGAYTGLTLKRYWGTQG